MLKKENLVKAGVTIPGFSKLGEVKKPLVAMIHGEKKNIFVIVEGIFPRPSPLSEESKLMIDGQSDDLDSSVQDIRGGIIDLSNSPPIFPEEKMSSYWADFYMDHHIPPEQKFASFKECKEKCEKFLTESGPLLMNEVEDLIILIAGKPFQNLSWITLGKRPFIPLTFDEKTQCERSSKSREYASYFNK
jgi:hypothetical protein